MIARTLAAVAAVLALAGCATAHAATSPHRHPAPDFMPTASAAPAGAAATAQPNWTGSAPVLTWTCATGYANTADGRTPTTNGVYVPGGPPAGDPYSPQATYQITATNPGTAPANVTSYTAVFYDQAGAEVTQDTESPAVSLVMPGQSLTWTYLYGQPGGAFPASCGIGTWNS